MRADSGNILVDGQPAATRRPARRAAAGHRHHLPGARPVPASERRREHGDRQPAASAKGAWARFRQWRRSAARFSTRWGSPVRWREPVPALSIGQRQLLAIARALSMNARLLLMDEPTSSLFDDAVERLFGLIRGLREPRRLDRLRLAQDGRDLPHLRPRHGAARRPDGRHARGRRDHAGRAHPHDGGARTRCSARRVRTPAARATSCSQVDGLTTGRAARRLVRRCIAAKCWESPGLVGAGRSELGAALFGLDRDRSGSILLHGAPFAPALAARRDAAAASAWCPRTGASRAS